MQYQGSILVSYVQDKHLNLCSISYPHDCEYKQQWNTTKSPLEFLRIKNKTKDINAIYWKGCEDKGTFLHNWWKYRLV